MHTLESMVFVETSNDWPDNAVDAVAADSTFGVLNARTGLIFNFPTEMQWEFAARGGQNDLYYGYSSAGLVGWYRSNAGSSPMEVGRKKPNAFGLYDTVGNIWEWCRDWTDGALPTGTEQTLVDYPGATKTAAQAANNPPQRVARGGFFDTSTSVPPYVYQRTGKKVNDPHQYYGLRLWAMER